MKKLIQRFTLITLIIAGQMTAMAQSNTIQHKKAKRVYIGGFFGGTYGYLDWNEAVEMALQKKGYTSDQISKMKTLTDIASHPQYMNTKDLFYANKEYLNGYTCYEILGFTFDDLKYKFIWIPKQENTTVLDGLKPTDDEGFFFIMHRMSIKSSKQDVVVKPIVTQAEIDQKNQNNALLYKQNKTQDSLYQIQKQYTYTVSYVLQKREQSFGSVSIYYSAVCIEVYDEYQKSSMSSIKAAADAEFDRSVVLNGYQVYETAIDKTDANSAKQVILSKYSLSDYRMYRTTLR